MSTVKVKIGGEIKNRLKLAINRVINIFESLVAIEKDIDKILKNELTNREKIKYKTKNQ